MQTSQSETEMMDTSEPSKSDDKKDEPESKSDEKKDDSAPSLVDKAYHDDKSRSQSKSPSPTEEKDKPTQNSDQTPAEPAQSNEEPGNFFNPTACLKC